MATQEQIKHAMEARFNAYLNHLISQEASERGCFSLCSPWNSEAKKKISQAQMLLSYVQTYSEIDELEVVLLFSVHKTGSDKFSLLSFVLDNSLLRKEFFEFPENSKSLVFEHTDETIPTACRGMALKHLVKKASLLINAKLALYTDLAFHAGGYTEHPAASYHKVRPL